MSIEEWENHIFDPDHEDEFLDVEALLNDADEPELTVH